ncbi:MAG: transketolase C-terminal domain-containing protein, partial [Verrucomicrobiota bacterium]
MAADNSVVAKVELPPLRPLAVHSPLAPTPAGPPKYAVTVHNAAGAPVVLGDPRATRALVALMDVHAVNGGAACHWGGPAAFAEVNAAIHGLMFSVPGRPWHEAFNYVNDAGHAENGIYALRANYGFDGLTLADLRAFRSIQSKLTGHGESHLNPEGVLLSNGPLSSAVGQAQGLAIGDQLAGRDRVTLCVVSDGASMEGEARESFAAIPGLAARGRVNPFVLVISDNDTKLSGRITQDAYSMQPSFEAMDDLGWEVRRVGNGHDLAAVYLAVERAVADARANPARPVCLWLKTVKGYGIQATEQNSSGGHGFPLANGEKIPDWIAELYRGDTPPAEFVAWAAELRAEWERKEADKKARAAAAPATPATPAAPVVKKDKVQAGLAAGALRAAREGYPVYSVSSDVQGSTGISAFQKATGRFLEVGIAEANMVSVGAGLSKVGFIPIVDTFGQFGVTKGNLPLTMAALSQAPVIALFSHVGFQDAADGASHQATTYFAAVGAIPHTLVVAPSCANEAEAFMYDAIRHIAEERQAGRDGESVIFFVGRENYPVEWVPGATYAWGRAQVIQDGTDVVLIGSGVLFNKCLEAARILAGKGRSAVVINNPFVNRVDVETIGAAVRQCGGRVVTIEDHQLIGGMGAMVSHALSRSGIAHRMTSLGIDGEFGQSAYLAEELYVKHGLTGPRMAEAALA